MVGQEEDASADAGTNVAAWISNLCWPTSQDSRREVLVLLRISFEQTSGGMAWPWFFFLLNIYNFTQTSRNSLSKSTRRPEACGGLFLVPT